MWYVVLVAAILSFVAGYFAAAWRAKILADAQRGIAQAAQKGEAFVDKGLEKLGGQKPPQAPGGIVRNKG